MAKNPEERFESMSDFCSELESCLAELDGRSEEGATMIVPAHPRPRRARRRHELRVPWGPILLVLLAALLVAGGAYLLLRDDGGTPFVAKTASSGPVQLQGLGAYDPEGDGSEHGEDAHFATDHDGTTSWDTETYNNFQKGGVGLVLQAPRAVALSKLTVQSVGSNFDAQIKAGSDSGGPFADVSGDFQPVGAAKSFSIDTHGKKYRYYLVWLKLPFEGGQAKISEVTART
jgi:hypothetical protein